MTTTRTATGGGVGRYWLPHLLRHEIKGQDWRHRAACRDTDPEVFYPLDTSPTSAAVAAPLAVCAGCPVRLVCLTDALAGEDPARRWGVLGGTTPQQRAALFVAARVSDPTGHTTSLPAREVA